MEDMIGFIRQSALIIFFSLMISSNVSSQESSVKAEQAIRNTHAEWFNDLLNENVKALNLLLSEDVTLSFGGNLMPRSQFLSYLKDGVASYENAEHKNSMVRVYGKTGIVTGRSNLSYTFNGNAGYERLSYIAVYIRKNGRWRMVAWQSAMLPSE